MKISSKRLNQAFKLGISCVYINYRRQSPCLDYLTTERGLSRDEACMLTSAAADLHVTEVVDGVKGVHAMLPKAIFTGSR